jgi:hypothetical protein
MRFDRRHGLRGSTLFDGIARTVSDGVVGSAVVDVEAFPVSLSLTP